MAKIRNKNQEKRNKGKEKRNKSREAILKWKQGKRKKKQEPGGNIKVKRIASWWGAQKIKKAGLLSHRFFNFRFEEFICSGLPE